MRQVVVANQEKHGYVRLREAMQALSELPLVCLGWVPRTICVATEEYQVNALLDGVVNHFVEGGESVQQTRGQAGCGVGAPVVLDAYVQVGEV
jgi:hypothetical protein